MILGKREGSSRKRPFKLLTWERRTKESKGQENYKTISYSKPKTNQSHPPMPHPSRVTFPPLPCGLPARSRFGEGRGEGEGEGENSLLL